MFTAMHEWDLEAVIIRDPSRQAPAAAVAGGGGGVGGDGDVHDDGPSFVCTWRWPPSISSKALVCTRGGRLPWIADWSRAWAEAKYRVLFAMAGQLAARTPVDLLVNCHAGKVSARLASHRPPSSRGQKPSRRGSAAAAEMPALAESGRHHARRGSAAAAVRVPGERRGSDLVHPLDLRRKAAEFEGARRRSEQFARLGAMMRSREAAASADGGEAR